MPSTPQPAGGFQGSKLPDGTMMRKGSGGRTSLPTQTEWDVDDEPRCNPVGLDGVNPSPQWNDFDDPIPNGFNPADDDYFTGPDADDA